MTVDASLQNISPRIGGRYDADDNQFGLRGLDHFALETLDIELGRVRHIFLRVGTMLVQCAEPKNGEISVRKDDPNVSPHFAFAVSAEHLDRNVERLRRLHIPVQGPVRHRGVDVVSCYFQSPEGHKLEICTWDPYPADKAPYGRIDWPALAHDWPRAG
jgi:hypothetical protein